MKNKKESMNFEEILMSKLKGHQKLDDNILKDIRIKTVELGSELEGKDFEDTLSNIEIEFSKFKDPQVTASVLMYCMSKLPIELQKLLMEGQKSIIAAFLTRALVTSLFMGGQEEENKDK